MSTPATDPHNIRSVDAFLAQETGETLWTVRQARHYVEQRLSCGKGIFDTYVRPKLNRYAYYTDHLGQASIWRIPRSEVVAVCDEIIAQGPKKRVTYKAIYGNQNPW